VAAERGNHWGTSPVKITARLFAVALICALVVGCATVDRDAFHRRLAVLGSCHGQTGEHREEELEAGAAPLAMAIIKEYHRLQTTRGAKVAQKKPAP